MKFFVMRASLTRCMLASLVFVVATSWSPVALAIAVMGSVERDIDRDYEVNLVSRADCEAPAQYTFHLTDVTPGASLSVWGTGTGADCLQTTSRSGADAQCFLIRDIGNITTMTTDVVLSGSDIALVLTGVSGCVDTSGVSTARAVKIYFLENETQGNVPMEQSTTYDMQVDMVGPPPPTAITVGIHSDNAVLVGWTPPGDVMDVAGYVVFCGGSSLSTTTSGAGGMSGAGGSTAFGVGGFVGAGGAAVGGAGGMVGAGGSEGGTSPVTNAVVSAASTSTGSGTSTCSSPDLVPGEIPKQSKADACAEVTTAQTTEVEAPATPNVDSAYAVASFDKLDNVGPLSEVVCGKPEPTTDFFEEYRRAGGQAGGGFCNCALVGADSDRPLALVALLLGAVGFGLRRRRGAMR